MWWPNQNLLQCWIIKKEPWLLLRDHYIVSAGMRGCFRINWFVSGKLQCSSCRSLSDGSNEIRVRQHVSFNAVAHFLFVWEDKESVDLESKTPGISLINSEMNFRGDFCTRQGHWVLTKDDYHAISPNATHAAPSQTHPPRDKDTGWLYISCWGNVLWKIHLVSAVFPPFMAPNLNADTLLS